MSSRTGLLCLELLSQLSADHSSVKVRLLSDTQHTWMSYMTLPLYKCRVVKALFEYE